MPDGALPDLRVSALSYISVVMLRGLQAWQRIDECFCVLQRRLKTWAQPASVVAFNIAALSLPELGFWWRARRLRQVLW